MQEIFVMIVTKNEDIANLKKNTLFVFFLLFIYAKGNEKDHSLIYMLMWSTPQILPFQLTDLEQQYFTKRNCQFQNCFVTNNKSYFKDITDFDVLLFNVLNIDITEPPPVRSEKQKYVFMSDEPPAFYPMPLRFDGVFNLTWTYRFDSNATLKYFIVRNKEGDVIGPKKNMHWMNVKDMKPTSKSTISKLQNKKTAAVWFVSHCDTPIQREQYVQKLKEELDKYRLNVDIFGRCGNLKCPKATKEKCHALVESDYYFYLAFENSMCEDYVTEKLLTALEHYAVPVVYGGANYTQFVPEGIYLDASALLPDKLAEEMNDIIQDKNKYYDYFKWHSYYSFHAANETAETDEICAFCAYLNNKKHDPTRSFYSYISQYWLY